MKYKIYEVVEVDHLKKVYQDGYHTSTKERNVLEEVTFYDFKTYNSFDSLSDAESAIQENKDDLKHKTLTVLPIWEVNYEGEVK